MTVEKEGTIEVHPDGKVTAEGFILVDGDVGDLYNLVKSRVLEAAKRIRREKWEAETE